MASMNCVMSEDQFLCSICLEVFTDPVTTPCGHSFCKTCINKHWDNSDQCQCPVCKEDFNMRPQLKISTFISEMVTQFKKKLENESLDGSEIKAVESGAVLCDVCSESKAMKSCLVCLASYCQSHLEPHLTIPRLKRHLLIEPMENLEDRLCAEHSKTLELFCREDSQFICLRCMSTGHKNHITVPLKEEGEVVQANVKQMIEERQLKIEEIKRSVETSKKNAEQEIEKGVEVFNELMECVQQSLDRFKQGLENVHKEIEEQATEWIQELESEILELEKRRSEMEKMWCGSEDHLHFLQTFILDKPAPVVREWSEVTPKVTSYQGTVAKTIIKLWDMELNDEKNKILKAELRRVQQFATEVTLDPDTAHPNLVLFYNTQVHHSDCKKVLPDNPERFTFHICVVGKQKFSTGRTYFEVKVAGKTAWYLGMANESLERKGNISISPRKGFWLIHLSANVYKAYDNNTITLHLKSIPKKIGVFVDYEEGIVSFYDVDTAELIYSFTNNSFTEAILPLFNPGSNNKGENYAPLKIINPQTI